MSEILEFGRPPSWAYPTIGALWTTGTPLPERIRVLIHGRLDLRVEIDESLLINEDDTKQQIVEAAISQAGSYDVADFVERYVTIHDGEATVEGYILLEERIREEIEAWDDDNDEDILDAFIVGHGIVQDYGDFDLYLERL